MSDEPIYGYSDGGCDTRYGIGGWGGILKSGTYEKEYFGAVHKTTSQRMELTGALETLAVLRLHNRIPMDRQIVFKSDSAYLIKCFTAQWYVEWIKNGWRKKSNNKPVLNRDIWEKLLDMNQFYTNIRWQYCPESGSEYLQRCHTLAQEAMRQEIARSHAKRDSIYEGAWQ